MFAHKPSSFQDYLITSFMALVCFIILAGYLTLRRGYFFDGPATVDMWYLPNKAIAGTAALLLGLTLLLGPLSRYFNRFDHWLTYRKEIGIVAGLLAVLHGLVSFYFLPKKFPQASLIESVQSAPWGVLGAIFLLLLFAISFQKAILWLGSARWWFFQRWGLRLVIVLTLLHVGLMKWSGWERWFLEGARQTPELLNPSMAPASLLVALLFVWVITVRLYESVFLFRNIGFSTKEITMDEILRARGRRFFLISFGVTLTLFLVILFRWL